MEESTLRSRLGGDSQDPRFRYTQLKHLLDEAFWLSSQFVAIRIMQKILEYWTYWWNLVMRWDYSMSKEEKAAPDFQEPAKYYHLGLDVHLLIISNSVFIEHWHQTRPLCDHDGSKQKEDHSINMHEHRKKSTLLKPQKNPTNILFNISTVLLY